MGLLSGGVYSMTFDAATVARMVRLIDAAPIFARYYTTAMGACVNKVRAEAMGFAPVARGTLRRGITGYVQSPWVGVVGVSQAVPYARRRELGFYGTDSLGRTYADAGDFYLHQGLDASQAYIRATFATATQLSLREMFV